MAAFCGCCGAEIGPKAEACPVCGTPRHGMLSLDPAIQSDTGSKSDNPATMHPVFLRDEKGNQPPESIVG